MLSCPEPFVRHAAETVSVTMGREDECWIMAVDFNFPAQPGDGEVDGSRDDVRIQIALNARSNSSRCTVLAESAVSARSLKLL